jgi:hypothetical protein
MILNFTKLLNIKIMRSKTFLIIIILLSVSCSVFSQIRYVDIIPDKELTSPTSGSGSNSYCLDIDSNMVNDYVFSAGWVGCECAPGVITYSKASNFYAYNGSFFSCSTKSEEQIIDSLTIGNLTGSSLLLARCCGLFIGCLSGSSSNKEFIPLKLKKNNQFFYGWVRVYCPYEGYMIIKSYAYNTVAGQPIIASENATGSIIGGDTICLGNSTDTLKLVGYIGTVNKWQKRLNNGTWIDIANPTSTYIDMPSSSGIWEYRAEVQHGSHLGFSAVGQVVVKTLPPTPTITQSGSLLSSSSPIGNQWYWNNNYIPGANGQHFTCSISGSYTVVVTINGCPSAPSEPVIVNVGIEEFNNKNGFDLFPNPVENKLTIKINSTDFFNSKFTVYDIHGQILLDQTLKQNNTQISISQLPNGIYLARLQLSNGSMAQKKFVVVK